MEHEDETRRLLADLAAGQRMLTTEVRYLRARVPVRHGWAGKFVKDFETSPVLQYRIHRVFMYFWLANMPVVASLLVFAPGVWLKFALLLLTEYSLYANFATDYGAMSAAEAAHDFRSPPGFGT